MALLGVDLTSHVPGPAVRTAYHAQQAGFRYSLLFAHLALRALAARGKRPPRETIRVLEREYRALLDRDVANAERGLYPKSLLFQMPLLGYAKRLPRFLLDIPRSFLRSRRGNWRDVPDDVDLRRYPPYFRRTFHWQTDGYLSRQSAELYDLSVEFLFVGCADVMRRQVIPPMTRHARRRRGKRLRILDVGCGTGRTLSQVATALPGHQYFGVDLSPYYLEAARERLAAVPEVTLLADNAEKLPYRDGTFDIVTSVFLFHELPRRARRKVLAEMARVLAPGGLLVVEDSAQLAEASDLSFFLESFATDMHEPFYRDYVKDALEDAMAEVGLEPDATRRAWLSKVVTASRPDPGESARTTPARRRS